MGWCACLYICIWCTIYNLEAPAIVATLFMCTAGLLGLDTIADIWKKPTNTTPANPSEQESIKLENEESEQKTEKDVENRKPNRDWRNN